MPRRVIDLDAMAEEQAQKDEGPPVVIYQGREWTLPKSPPFAFVLIRRKIARDVANQQAAGRDVDELAIQEQTIEELMIGLFGRRQWDELVSSGFDMADFWNLLRSFDAVYQDQISPEEEGADDGAGKS